MKLSEIEFDAAKELINIGLAKAADSMSFFVKGQIMLKGLDFAIKELTTIEKLSQKQGEFIHVLATELKGDMTGSCFLILDDTDVKTLMKEGLSPSVQDDPIKAKAMGIAFLTELDNIITAAVVTQFADMLDMKLHGYVPTYHKYKQDELEESLRNKIKLDNYLLYFKVNLIVSHGALSPEFVWTLDQNFVNKVVALIQKQQVVIRSVN